MTDKQIIIDDIDVKQCKYFNSYQKIVRNNECIVDMQNACIEEIKTKPCSQKHNCYFKNWQRKEQECEQQKAELELFKTSNQTTIDQLKTENETLFKAIEEVNKINKRLESENEDLKKSVLQECPNCGEEYLNYKGAALYFENSDLKQTLADIKEIAEKNLNIHTCAFKGCGYDLITKQILQKINEVEDANNDK